MLKIGIIGIAAVFFAVLLKRDRPELSMLLSVACGTIIFAFALERLGTTIEFFKGLLSKLPVEPAFFVTMVKMLGIAYIAEFSSSICKDCGHSAIASQIELFAKGAIVVMSIPCKCRKILFHQLRFLMTCPHTDRKITCSMYQRLRCVHRETSDSAFACFFFIILYNFFGILNNSG